MKRLNSRKPLNSAVCSVKWEDFLVYYSDASIITMFEILDYLIISFAYDKGQAGPA